MGKKAISICLSTLLVSTTLATPALAADRDFYDKDGTVYRYEEYITDDEKLNELINALSERKDDFIVEFNGKGYNYAELLNNVIENNNDLNAGLEATSEVEIPKLINVQVECDDLTKVITITAKVPNAEDEATATIQIFAYTEDGEKEETAKVTVEEVAIEDDVIKVEVNAVDENLNSGDYVAVVAIGEEQAELDFTLDFEAVDAAVEAVNTANTQIKLKEALENPLFEGFNLDLLANYYQELVDNKAENYNTVAEIQEIIDRINEEAESNAEFQAIKEAINNAKNDFEIYNILSENFERINDEYINEYKEALLDVNGALRLNTKEDVQISIDDVNLNKAEELVTAAEGGEENNAAITEEKYNAALASLEWVAPDSEEENAATPKKDLEERLNVVAKLLAVINAEDADALYAALEALEIEDLDLREELKNKYFEEINKEEEGYTKGIALNTIEKVELVINGINTDEDERIAGLEINFDVESDNMTNPDVTIDYDEEKDLFTVTGDYLALEEYSENNDSPPATAKWIGLKIIIEEDLNDFNNGFDLILNGDDLREGLSLDGDNYLLYYFVPEAGGNENTLEFVVKNDNGDIVKNDILTIKFVDELSAEGVKVLVNQAETVEDVNDALLKLAEIENEKGIEYLNVESVDRMYIAKKVLEERDSSEDGKFAAKNDLETALGDAIEDRNAALIAVNDLEAESQISAVIDALEKVDPDGFANMTIKEKADIAEAFFNSLFKDGEFVSPSFRTLAAIKEAAGLE